MAVKKKKRRSSAQVRKEAVITDGCNPEFVEGARWSGTLEIPIIEKPEKIAIPSGFVPFSQAERVLPGRFAVCEYENDRDFADLLRDPASYVKELRRFQAWVRVCDGVISNGGINNPPRNWTEGYGFNSPPRK